MISEVAHELFISSNGAIDVANLAIEEPGEQPRQLNGSDCGVLLLCVARWIMEGFSLRTLRPTDVPALRERMIVELEKWRLD